MNRHIETDHIPVELSISNNIIESEHNLTVIPKLLFKPFLGTVQNGLNFLMDGLSLKMREAKEINRQSAITIQFQSEQINFLKQLNNQNKERNKILIIQHNKKLENFSNSLSDYVAKDFQKQLNQILENILDQKAYTAVIESGAISSLLGKLSGEIKTKIDKATSMIEVQDQVN
jgi:hypothetical protein